MTFEELMPLRSRMTRRHEIDARACGESRPKRKVPDGSCLTQFCDPAHSNRFQSSSPRVSQLVTAQESQQQRQLVK